MGLLARGIRGFLFLAIITLMRDKLSEDLLPDKAGDAEATVDKMILLQSKLSVELDTVLDTAVNDDTVDAFWESSSAPQAATAATTTAAHFNRTRGGALGDINATGDTSHRELTTLASLGEAHANLTIATASISRASIHKVISGTARNVSVIDRVVSANTSHRASSSESGNDTSGASLLAIAAGAVAADGKGQGYHRRLTTHPSIWLMLLVCAVGSALACLSLSACYSSAEFSQRESAVAQRESARGRLDCTAFAESEERDRGKLPSIISHDFDAPHESRQSLDSVQFQPRIAGHEQPFRRDAAVPALSLGFAKAMPQLRTPQMSPRLTQHYSSPRGAVENPPPPLCPALVMPVCEARFAVPLHILAQIDVGQFDVVGPSGTPLLAAVLRRGPRGKYLELSLTHASYPHVLVGPPSQQGFQICGPGGVYYGMLAPQASGSYLVLHGAQNLQVMCIDVTGRQVDVSTPDGHSLASASISASTGVEHLELKVHNGVDSLLVISTVLAIFLLGAGTPGNVPSQYSIGTPLPSLKSL